MVGRLVDCLVGSRPDFYPYPPPEPDPAPDPDPDPAPAVDMDKNPACIVVRVFGPHTRFGLLFGAVAAEFWSTFWS